MAIHMGGWSSDFYERESSNVHIWDEGPVIFMNGRAAMYMGRGISDFYGTGEQLYMGRGSSDFYERESSNVYGTREQ